MKFFYRKVPVNSYNSIFLPLLEVKLGEKGLPLVCLVDSGATFSFFHATFGRQIGISVEDGISVFAGGVTGANFRAFLHKGVVLEIGGIKRLVDIAFSDELGMPYNLLGQLNFFEEFRVCFDLSKQNFEITPKH